MAIRVGFRNSLLNNASANLFMKVNTSRIPLT